MSIYMKIPNITGNVSTRSYQGCIELLNTKNLGKRTIQQITGQGTQREMSHLHLDHMRITKHQDAASAELYQYFCSGKNIPQLDIYHIIMMQGSPEWRVRITLQNVMLAQHNEQLSAEGSLEMIDLAFTKIEKSYKQQGANGQFQTPSTSGYNIETAEVM